MSTHSAIVASPRETIAMTDAKIFVAGHRGLVGSAIVRNLLARGVRPDQLILRTHAELELTDGRAVEEFFAAERPTQVYLAAARVGGIHANNSYPADFIRDNLMVQTNVIHAAHVHGVDRLLFLGSSCIYPKLAPQPLAEDSLLSGPLEPTNRPYAVAKIAGIEMCWSYNRQFGARFLSVMPTNLYGPGDNYHPENSHVIPALIRRFHEAKMDGKESVVIWGTGTPRREFMFVEDMADACVHIMRLPAAEYLPLLAAERNDGLPPVVNIGVGDDVSIADLAKLVARTVGFDGRIEFDASRPDGTPQKLMDCSRLSALGWRATTALADGLSLAYMDFKARHSA
jgi:GDP-L-fucose synthase